jgi:hypothetical protein
VFLNNQKAEVEKLMSRQTKNLKFIKMKKISLKNISEGLKRDEMRMIQGGSGCGAPAGSHCYLNHGIFNCAPALRCVPKPEYSGDIYNGICV